jgi:hypothetical protein
MRLTPTAVLATLALAALSLAPAARAAEATLTLTLKDHHFDPAEPTIPANTRVHVTVKNLDATPAEFESDDFKAEKVVPAGQEVKFYIGPLKAGTYEFHDEYHEDESKTHLTAK